MMIIQKETCVGSSKKNPLSKLMSHLEFSKKMCITSSQQQQQIHRKGCPGFTRMYFYELLALKIFREFPICDPNGRHPVSMIRTN